MSSNGYSERLTSTRQLSPAYLFLAATRSIERGLGDAELGQRAADLGQLFPVELAGVLAGHTPLQNAARKPSIASLSAASATSRTGSQHGGQLTRYKRQTNDP